MLIDQIICGRAEEVLAGFPAECIDLTVTSPPYDGLRTYNGYTFDFQAIAAQLYRVTKPGGVVVWVVADETKDGSESGTSFRQALGFMEIGFKLHDTMIYEKANPIFINNDRYNQAVEYMFVLGKGAPKTFNPLTLPCSYAGSRTAPNYYQRNGGLKDLNGNGTIKDTKKRPNIWRYTVGNNNGDDDTDHPAKFPEKLAEDHILSWSNAGDVVLDPMCGSGTTCKMAIKHHRSFIGVDISEAYCALARRRIAAVQPTMFDVGIL